MLLAEANQWPEDVVEYFGDGDECHMAFHFPVMPRMFMAVRREDATPIYEILDRTPAIPDNCQWGLFLRNHDELTLEMVTDEERDYMYAEYAKDPRMKLNLGIRRRLAPLLDAGFDENAAPPRDPLLAAGFAGALLRGRDRHGRQRLSRRPRRRAHADAVVGRPQRRLLARRLGAALLAAAHGSRLRLPGRERRGAAAHAELAPPLATSGSSRCGSSIPCSASATTGRSAATTRASSRTSGRGRRTSLVCVHNLARSAQAVQLDLSEYAGMVPVEMLGETAFPAIGELPYLLTLAPRGFFWFQLRAAEQEE